MLQKLTMPSTPHKHSYTHSLLSVALGSVVRTGESSYANQDGEDEELNLAGENGGRGRKMCTGLTHFHQTYWFPWQCDPSYSLGMG